MTLFKIELQQATLNKLISSWWPSCHYLTNAFGWKSFILIMCQVCNLPIMHPTLLKTVHYSVEDEYLTLSSDGDSTTISLENDMVTCIVTRGNICQFSTALYLTDKFSWCLYMLFVNDTEQLKMNCKLWGETTNPWCSIQQEFMGN